jgi:hypothetical protein
MITANRRAKATVAFFIPRRLAICIDQALSQDHFSGGPKQIGSTPSYSSAPSSAGAAV